MFGECKRFVAVLMLLMATLAGQTRWQQGERSDDTPEHPWQRRLEAAQAIRSEQALPPRTLQARHWQGLPPIFVSMEGQWVCVPEVQVGSGAPRAPGHA